MSHLPTISGPACVRALSKVGFRLKRREGRHKILRRNEPFAQVVVPKHRELGQETLRLIIRHAGLSVEEFERLLGGEPR